MRAAVLLGHGSGPGLIAALEHEFDKNVHSRFPKSWSPFPFSGMQKANFHQLYFVQMSKHTQPSRMFSLICNIFADPCHLVWYYTGTVVIYTIAHLVFLTFIWFICNDNKRAYDKKKKMKTLSKAWQVCAQMWAWIRNERKYSKSMFLDSYCTFQNPHITQTWPMSHLINLH